MRPTGLPWVMAMSVGLLGQGKGDFPATAAELVKAKSWSELEAQARAAQSLRPKDPVPLMYLGIALGEQGKGKEGLEAFKACTQVAPLWRAAWFNLGMAALNQGDRPVLIEAMTGEVALQVKPGSPRLATHPDVLTALCDNPDPASHDPSECVVVRYPGSLNSMATGQAWGLVQVDAQGKVQGVQFLAGPASLRVPLEYGARAMTFKPLTLKAGATHAHYLFDVIAGMTIMTQTFDRRRR